MQLKIKPVILAIFAVSVLQSASAELTEKVWVGPDGGDWSVAENWDPKGRPDRSSVAVFRPSGSLRVTLSMTALPGIGGMRFESGDTLIESLVNRDDGASDYGTVLRLPDGTNDFYVAVGATAVVSNMFNSLNSRKAFFRKTGGGEFVMRRNYGDGYGYLGGYIISDGAYVVRTAKTYPINGGVRIEGKGLLRAEQNYPFNDNVVLDIDEGGVLDCNAKAIYADGINGGGTITNAASVTLWLRQPCRLDGRIVGGAVSPSTVPALTINRTDIPSGVAEKDWGVTVGAADSLAAVFVTMPNVEAGHALRFASGVGEFRVRKLQFNAKPYLTLEDESGLPVSLITQLTQNPLRLKGAGTFWQTTGNVSVYGPNSDLSGFTGRIGAKGANVTFTLGGNTADTACDLSSVGSFVLRDGATLDFRQDESGAQILDRLDAVGGSVSFYGDLTFGIASVLDTTWNLQKSCSLTVCGGHAEIGGAQNLTAGQGASLTVSGGAYVGGVPKKQAAQTWSVIKRPYAVYVRSGRNGLSAEVKNGGTLQAQNMPGALSVHDGGTYVLGSNATAAEAPYSDENPSVLSFDGGTYRGSVSEAVYTLDMLPDSSTRRLQVGTKGLTLDFDMADMPYSGGWHIFTFLRPLYGSGPVTRTGAGWLKCSHPWQITGTFDNRDGTIQIANYAALEKADTPLFGTGDFRLGNARLEYASGILSDFEAKFGTGGRFCYDGAAFIRTRESSSAVRQTMTFGALVRGGQGAGVFFGSYGKFTDTGSTVKFTTTPEANAAGCVKGPVFTVATADADYGSSRRIDFAGYDETTGLRTFSNYTEGLSGGADSVARIFSTAVTLTTSAAVSALCVDGQPASAYEESSTSAPLTIATEKTLTVGSGEDPAVVIMNPGYNSWRPAAIKGGGTLSFGSREGVIAVGPLAAGTYPSYIKTTIAGSGGLSIIGLGPETQNHRFCLSAANTYTGGTFVNGTRVVPHHAQAFSSGDITLGDGELSGGGLYFDMEGLEISNTIHAAGWGTRHSSAVEGYGALLFAASTCLTGTVDAYAPLRMSVTAADAEGVFAGVVSGTSVQLWKSAGKVVFTGANTYTGGTEVVASTLVLRNGGTAGTGSVLLDNGTLEIDSAVAVTMANPIRGIGTIRLPGKGKVTFADLQAEDSQDGFALNIGTRQKVVVPTLDGFASVTSERDGDVLLYVEDGKPFAGDLSANITCIPGVPPQQGLLLIVR